MKPSSPCRLVLTLLSALLLGSPVRADERSTARRFEAARRDEPSLIAFLRAMPKGGDLHNHFGATVFAEDALDVAVRTGLFYNPSTTRFEAVQSERNVPAARLLTDAGLRRQFFNAASMRGPVAGPAGGHDHFFDTFGVFSSATNDLDPAEILWGGVQRARLQNLHYLELMMTPAGDALEQVRRASVPGQTAALALVRLRPQIETYVRAARSEMDRWESVLRKHEAELPPAERERLRPVTVRYLVTAYRADRDERIQATWAAGFSLMKADPRVVGVNFAAPEDDPAARSGFDRQMRILDDLWRQFDRPNVTLHAGELNLWISPVEDMTHHIRRSIEIGHARRIGHGTAVAWEDDVAGLLRKMKEEGIAVEVCPSSSAVILGQEGDRHPFRLYWRAGVPVTLNTDDEGVSRSNLTMELVRAVRSWNLTYTELKRLARNSLEYSFLEGESLWEGHDYSRPRKELRRLKSRGWMPDPANSGETARLSASPKAAAQARLERALVEFEK